MATWEKVKGSERRRRLAAGEMLLDAMEISQSELARRLDVSRQVVHLGLRDGAWNLERLKEAAEAAGMKLEVETVVRLRLSDSDGESVAQRTLTEWMLPDREQR